MKRTILKYVLVVIIASATVWQCIGAWQDSQTTDEAVHLVAGRSYWQTGSFELNPEHPALFKLLASLPLTLLPQGQIPTNTVTWKSRNEWTIGAQYLYYSPPQAMYGTRFLMFAGRLPMVMIWLGLVTTVAWVCWKRWGAYAAIAGTTALAYDPSFLGHGHLVTNDVAMAFAYLGTFLALGYYLAKPTGKRLLWLSVVFTLAQLTKFSSLALWTLVPFIMIMAIIYRRPHVRWRSIWTSLGAFIVVGSFLTWMVYGFSVNRIDNDPRIAQLWQQRDELIQLPNYGGVPPLVQKIIRLSDPATPTGQFLNRFQQASIPAYWYWRGVFSATSHNYFGHGAYLLGQVSEQGWWYYFPVALFVKTPFIVLVTVLGYCLFFLRTTARQWHRGWRQALPIDFWLYGFPPLAFLVISMNSHINIGFRHVFPTYVYFPIAVAAAVAACERRWPRRIPLATACFTISVIVITTSAWPNTIGYFSGLVGGTEQGHKYILDSNLDWNQDVWRLRSYLKKNNFPEVHIALFGSIPVDTIFKHATGVLTEAQIRNGATPTGVIIVSQGYLYSDDTPLHWLRRYIPSARIGSSLNVYDFR